MSNIYTMVRPLTFCFSSINYVRYWAVCVCVYVFSWSRYSTLDTLHKFFFSGVFLEFFQLFFSVKESGLPVFYVCLGKSHFSISIRKISPLRGDIGLFIIIIIPHWLRLTYFTLVEAVINVVALTFSSISKLKLGYGFGHSILNWVSEITARSTYVARVRRFQSLLLLLLVLVVLSIDVRAQWQHLIKNSWWIECARCLWANVRPSLVLIILSNRNSIFTIV